MSSVRLSPQSASLLPTFVPNPYDPLDVQNSSKDLTTDSRFALPEEKEPSLILNYPQIPAKDQIDAQELQSLLKAIKNLNPKPKSTFNIQSKWLGPILTIITAAAAIYAYKEYSILSEQNAQCQKDLTKATQNANLVPLTVQALFPDATNFIATTAKTVSDYFTSIFQARGLKFDSNNCNFMTQDNQTDPSTGAIHYKKMNCLPLSDKIDSRKFEYSHKVANSENSVNIQSIDQFTCTEEVIFDHYHYKMNINANCTGEYLTSDSKHGKYNSQEKMILSSQAKGPDSFLHIEHTICESEELNGNTKTSCSTLNTDTTIEEFSKKSSKSEMLNQILASFKG